jgi:hypothetical protein
MMLLCAACAPSIQVQAPTVGCSELIPDSWSAPVPSAVLGSLEVGAVVVATPGADARAAAAATALATAEAEAERWQVFGIQQTGQLRVANDRDQAKAEIYTKCAARDATAARSLRPWYQRLFN